jgi:transcriptional regulator with XRE-family HTH domain
MRKLETVADLLDALREEREWPSDYRIGKELGIKHTTVSAWRTGRAVPREKHALIIASALRISPTLVMAISIAQQSKDKSVRDAWAKVVKQIARAGLPALAAFLISTKAYMPPKKVDDVSLHILSNRRRKRRVARPADMLQAA